MRCITDERALLGESPLWSAEEGCVYWVDILGRKLHRTNPDNLETRTWDLPSCAGMIALRRQGGLVVALEDGLYGFDPGSGRLDRLAAFEDDLPGNRPNDGKCDAQGRLWVGTMNKTDGSLPTGNFYRIDPDLRVTKIETGYCIPNGLAWSPDNSVMYHTDTRSNLVRAWDFDPATGERTEAREFFAFERETSGGVDGAAMDTRGGYWAALYGGGRLVRVSPEGAQDREIPLPVSQPTMPAFGGPDMKTIFITSASQKLGADELASQPLAGGLLSVAVDVRG
ncbi:MAG: SMP-30/gluconolactonase/LRE family protein, partial [Proteobacteria bacterium]|nr:SMP-30/gluconolactonase/LRE family protein [Pseudomonadota bacterium]